MGLPVVQGTPANNLINGATSGTQSLTPGAGETAIVFGSTTAGGSSVSVTGAGGTWTSILEVSDGTRTWFCWRGSGITSGSSQTVTVSFSNTTTCRWSWVRVTGIDATTPDDQTGSNAPASATRTSIACVSAAVTTPANVLCVCGMATSSSPASTISAPSGFTRITASGVTSFVLCYGVIAAGLSSSTVSITHPSSTYAAQCGFASFNGDNQGGAPSTSFKNLLTLGVG